MLTQGDAVGIIVKGIWNSKQLVRRLVAGAVGVSSMVWKGLTMDNIVNSSSWKGPTLTDHSKVSLFGVMSETQGDMSIKLLAAAFFALVAAVFAAISSEILLTVCESRFPWFVAKATI
jgi:hypothetical protein